MDWQHRRDRTKAEEKSEEPRSGTNWWFVAGVVPGA
jgi:hypothetical protein